jgi:hypothetical protein
MSYDLMVFEPSAAPRDRAHFMEWHNRQVQWSEGHGYSDPTVASPALQRWYQDMIQFYPSLNGPLASNDVDNPKLTDHCIGMHVIYSAFAWSCAVDDARATMRALAAKHAVGFFDVSSDEGEIVFPGDFDKPDKRGHKPWWKLW